MHKSTKPIFTRAVASLAFCFALSLFLYSRATKNKADFTATSGVVEYLENNHPFYPNKNAHKFRYLKVEGYAKPFELFIGKDAGDFKPRFERVDLLQPGDTVTVYYDENLYTKKDPVSRLVYFIDRKQETIFVKGHWEKNLAYFLAAISLIVLVWVLRLKQRGKIS